MFLYFFNFLQFCYKKQKNYQQSSKPSTFWKINNQSTWLTSTLHKFTFRLGSNFKEINKLRAIMEKIYFIQLLL